MVKSIEKEEFLKLSVEFPVLDVRTPAEYKYGHIPGANNLPLFTDEERKIVGTLYKKEGREPAIIKGLELVGPKLADIIKSAQKFVHRDSIEEKTLLLYCWRGGMRSSSVAWLLELYGFKIFLLKGGYKSFRRFVLNTFHQPRKLLILGGKTGCGKTLILKQLLKCGEQIIDLESMANHKGSSFGALGEQSQPSQEQFENQLAMHLKSSDVNKTIWVEDESRSVGKIIIPQGLWEQMRNNKIIDIHIPFHERVENLVKDYGKYPSLELKEAVLRIQKRLGGLNFKLAIAAIDEGNLQQACEIILSYYDKTYEYGINKREPSFIIKYKSEKLDIQQMTQYIIKGYGKN